MQLHFTMFIRCTSCATNLLYAAPPTLPNYKAPIFERFIGAPSVLCNRMLVAYSDPYAAPLSASIKLLSLSRIEYFVRRELKIILYKFRKVPIYDHRLRNNIFVENASRRSDITITLLKIKIKYENETDTNHRSSKVKV